MWVHAEANARVEFGTGGAEEAEEEGRVSLRRACLAVGVEGVELVGKVVEVLGEAVGGQLVDGGGHGLGELRQVEGHQTLLGVHHPDVPPLRHLCIAGARLDVTRLSVSQARPGKGCW